MRSFTKYLAANQEARDWGFYINAVGSNKIEPHRNYPLGGHPSKYSFNWENGRIHNDYHLIYITSGGGVYEDLNQSYKVVEGDIILISSGEWHRYKPDTETGWRENFIGFNGHLVKHFIDKLEKCSENPVIGIGKSEVLIELFDRVFENVENENPCFQLTSSSIVIDIISRIISHLKQKDLGVGTSRAASVINEVRFYIRENVEKEIDFKEVARAHNMAYSHFRKLFKKFTGFSPLQYHIYLKVNKAKELLLESDMTVKEIAFQLGFKSIHYFGRVFKQKLNVSPTSIRKQGIATTSEKQ